MNSNLGHRLRFYLEIRKALGALGDIDYSVITGGFVKNDDKLGDVDIVTVLSFVTSSTQKRILKFAECHTTSQLAESFTPDYKFPTDVVSKQQIIDATGGRSFEVVNDLLNLKNYSHKEIVTNPEADYRVWLYEMITHDFDLIAGNFESLVRDTTTALRTTFLWAAQLYGYKGSIKIEKLRTDIFLAAGLSYKLSEKQCRYLLIMLDKEELGKIGPGDTIILNSRKIRAEIDKLKKILQKHDSFLAQHILPWDLLRKKVVKYIK